VLVQIAFITGVGIALYLPHIIHGGRAPDDWAFAAYWKLDSHAYFLHQLGPGRPLTPPLFLLVYSLLGTNAHFQAAACAVAGVLMAIAVRVALPRYRISESRATFIACLVLAFGPADSPRIGNAGWQNELALALFMFGAALAADGLSAGGKRRIVLHGASLALYVLSILTYEAAVGILLISGAGYSLIQRGRQAVTRWVADLCVVAFALLALAGTDARRLSVPVGVPLLVHAAKFVAGAGVVGTWAVFPLGSSHHPDVGRAIGVLLLVSAVVLGARGFRADAATRYWLTAIAGGIIFAAASYLPYIPGRDYLPVGEGFNNRINILSEVGFVIAAYGMVEVLGHAAASRWRRLDRRAVTWVGLALIAIGYGAATLNDEARWARAADKQRQTIKLLSDLGRSKALGRHLLVFGVPRDITFGYTVFDGPTDLSGALQLLWHDASVIALPVIAQTTLICGPESAGLTGGDFTGTPLMRYGTITFVDVNTREVVHVRNATMCSTWGKRFLAQSPPQFPPT
jgi:hypothetical protein